MSNIEERVVVLKFDNASFERNTKQSMETLDKLDKRLKSADSGKSLEGLGKAAGSINLSSVTKAIDTVNHRFSALGIVGATALSKLTSSALSFGKNLVTTIPKMIWEGGWKRAFNIEQAKFKIEGLNNVWDESSVKAKAWAEKVKEAGSEAKAALDFNKEKVEAEAWAKFVEKAGGETSAQAKLIKNNVLDAVRGTAAGLDEAGGVAAQFLASGLQAGSEMTSALRGIAGVSAMTSSSFQDIGNVFTTVAGNGRVMAQQLNQIAYRGLNAAATLKDYINRNDELRKQIIDVGLNSKMGKQVEEFANATKLTERNIRTLVSAGAIDFQTFYRAMDDAFGEHAKKANDTYAGSLENLKAAFSRLGESVQSTRIVNLRKVFNTLIPVIDGIHDKLKPLISRLNEVQNKVTEFFTRGITKVAKAFGLIKEEDKKAAETTTETAKAAVKATTVTTKAADKSASERKKVLNQIKKDAKEASKTMTVTAREAQAAWDIWNKGTYGNGADRVRNLEAVGLSYKRVQRYVNELIRCNFDLDKMTIKVAGNSTKALSKTGEAGKKILTVTKREAQAAWDIWNKGTYGNGEARKRNLKAAGLEYKHVQAYVNELIRCNFDLDKMTIKVADNATKSIKKTAHASKKAAEEVKKTTQNAEKVAKVTNTTTDATSKKAEEAAKKNPYVTEKTAESLKKAAKAGDKYSKALLKNVKVLKLGDALLQVFVNTVKVLKNVVTGVWGVLKKVFAGFRNVAKGALGAVAVKLANLSERLVGVTSKFKEKASEIGAAIREKIGKAVDKIAPNFDKFKTGVKNKVISPLIDFFKNNETFHRLMKALGNAFLTLGKILVNAVKNFVEFIKVVHNSDGAKAFREQIKGLWEAFKPLAGKFFNGIAAGLESFNKSGGKINWPELLGKGVGKLLGALGKLIEIIRANSGSISSFFGMFKKIPGGIQKLVDVAKNGQGPLSKFFGLFSKKTDGFGGVKMTANAAVYNRPLARTTVQVKETKGLLENLVDAIKNFDIQKVFQTLFQAISGGFEKLKSLFAGGKISSFFKTVGDKLSKINIDKALARMWEFTKIIAVLKVVKDMGKFSTGASKALVSVSGFFDSLSYTVGSVAGVLDAVKKRIKQETVARIFQTIATSILMIAGAIVVLALLPREKLAQGAIAVAGVVAAVIVLMKVIGKMDVASLSKGAFVLLSAGASIMMISIAMGRMSKLSWPDIGKGAAAIGALMVIFIVASRLAGNVAAGVVSFAGMALGIDLLIPALWALAKMKPDTLKKGILCILLLAVTMAAAARIAGHDVKSAGAFIGMSLAITSMVPAILVLAMLPTEKALKACGMLAGIMLAVGFAARIATSSKKDLASMAGMALVIGSMAGSLLVLSLIPAGRLLKAAVALIGVFVAFSLAGKQAAMASEGILVIALTISMIALIITLLCALPDPDLAIRIALALAALAGAMGAAGVPLAILTKTLSKIPFVAGLKAIALLDLFLASLVGVLAGFGALSKAFPGFRSLIQEGGKVLADIGYAIGQFVGKIGEAFSKSLIVICDNIKKAIDYLVPGLQNLQKNVNPKLADAVGTLVKAMLMITGEQFLSAIANFLTFGAIGNPVQQIQTFATQLGELIPKMVEVTNEVGTLDPKKIDKLKKIAEAAEAFAELQHKITPNGKHGSVFQAFLGTKNLAEFGRQFQQMMLLVESVMYIISRKADVEGYGDPQTLFTKKNIDFLKNHVAPALEAFGDLQNALPESGWSLRKIIFGDKESLATFGSDIKLLMDAFGEVVKAVQESKALQDESVYALITNKVIPCIEAFKAIKDALPDEGLNLDVIGQLIGVHIEAGGTDMGGFGEAISALMSGFDTAATTVAKIENLDDKIEAMGKVTNAIKPLAEIAALLAQNDNVWKQDFNGGPINNLPKFAEKVAEMIPPFSRALQAATDAGLGTADMSPLESVAKVIKTLAKAAIEVPGAKDGTKMPNLSSWASRISAYASILNNVSTKNIRENSDSIAYSIKTIANSLKGDNYEKFSKIGKNTMGNYVKGLLHGGTGKNGAKSAVESVVKTAIGGFKGSYDRFKKYGIGSATMYAKGLNSDDARSAAAKNARKLANSAKGKNGIGSVSFYNAGVSAADGFAKGIDDNTYQAALAGANLGQAAYDAAKNRLNINSPSKKFMELGNSVGEGFMMGMSEYNRTVYKEGAKLAAMTLSGTGGILDSVDTDLTITPVLDLSNIADGARRIGGLLNSQSISTDVASSLYSRSGQNGSSNAEQTNTNNRFNVTMNISGADDPQEWGTKFIEEIRRQSRMRGA